MNCSIRGKRKKMYHLSIVGKIIFFVIRTYGLDAHVKIDDKTVEV